jgi:preprotein translocase subunit YajC
MIKKFSDEDLKKRKAKNIALLIILVVLVLIFYVMTWVRL